MLAAAAGVLQDVVRTQSLYMDAASATQQQQQQRAANLKIKNNTQAPTNHLVFLQDTISSTRQK
jgi:uncharacterized protein affecting Mg2+/Co2+ transport